MLSAVRMNFPVYWRDSYCTTPLFCVRAMLATACSIVTNSNTPPASAPPPFKPLDLSSHAFDADWTIAYAHPSQISKLLIRFGLLSLCNTDIVSRLVAVLYAVSQNRHLDSDAHVASAASCCEILELISFVPQGRAALRCVVIPDFSFTQLAQE